MQFVAAVVNLGKQLGSSRRILKVNEDFVRLTAAIESGTSDCYLSPLGQLVIGTALRHLSVGSPLKLEPELIDHCARASLAECN